MQASRFDIILPTIGRDSLEAAIDSVIAQDYPHWRLYVMCEGFQWPIKDDRIYIIANPEIQHGDSGAWARNHAIWMGKSDPSEWIAYIDDDDIWHPHHLSTISSLIASNPQATMVRTAGQIFSFRRKTPRTKKTVRRVGQVNTTDILTVGMAHTRELFERTTGWKPEDNHDRILWNEMISLGGSPVVSEAVTFEYQR